MIDIIHFDLVNNVRVILEGILGKEKQLCIKLF